MNVAQHGELIPAAASADMLFILPFHEHLAFARYLAASRVCASHLTLLWRGLSLPMQLLNVLYIPHAHRGGGGGCSLKFQSVQS
jgi:hypothetical protein